MTFRFEPLTDDDRARLRDLNVQIHWHKPNTNEWTIDRDSGDFLIWIAPDRDPPHWTRFAFHHEGHLYGAEFNLSGSTVHSGYRAAVMKVWLALGDWHLAGADADRFLDRLTAAFESYCAAHVRRLCAELAARRGVEPDAEAPVIKVIRRGLQACPVVVFEADLPPDPE